MSELGLFPLGIVLLPTEQIPLHIFEDRYQELIGECLALEREFGLIYADEAGLPVRLLIDMFTQHDLTNPEPEKVTE